MLESFDPKPYQYCENFTVIQAAFLWIEIEPTQEQLDSPPMKVVKFAEALCEHLRRVEHEKYTQLIKEIAQDSIPSGFAEWNEKFCKHYGLPVTELSPPISERELDLFLMETVWVHQFALPSPHDSARRIELILAAENLGDRPRFLFPDPDNSNSKNLLALDFKCSEKPVFPKKRSSYLTIIYALLKDQGIDPRKRGMTRELSKKIERKGLSLGDDAIRNILKELQELNPE